MPHTYGLERESLGTVEGRLCLEVRLHLHAPALDGFDEAAWERTIRTRLEGLVGFQVAEVEVTDVEARIRRIITLLRDPDVSPVILEVIQLEEGRS